MRTNKALVIAAVISAGLIPLSSYAWHGGPCWDRYDGPQWHHGYDAPCGYWGDAPMRRHHYRGGPRMMHDRGVHTFGMNHEEAVHFMNEVGTILGVKASDKAWQQTQQAYAQLAQVRCDHRNQWKPGMTRQARLEARSEFMNKHAQAFDAYVKARAELLKVLGEEKMAQFDYVVNTGSILEPPMPPKGPQPAPKAAR